MNIEEITYHRLEEKHLPDAQWLFKTVYNKEVSAEYLKRKYDGSYLGVDVLGFIAYYEGKPVSLFGAIAQKFTYNGKEILAMHTCDSFTTKEFQGKGLHYQLGVRNAELAKVLGFSFLYGFHNLNTIPIKVKLKWSTHKHLARFHIKIKTLPLVKVFARLKASSLYDAVAARLLKKYESKNGLEYSCENAGQVYDQKFLQYKNSMGRHYCLEIHRCQFLFKIESTIKVGVFTSPDPDSFNKAIQKLKRLAFWLGIPELEFHVYENTTMYNRLKSISQPHQSWLIGYCPIEEIDINRFEFNLADFDTF